MLVQALMEKREKTQKSIREVNQSVQVSHVMRKNIQINIEKKKER